MPLTDPNSYFPYLVRAVALLLFTTIFSGCTVLNKATFEIQPSGSTKQNEVIIGIEAYFNEIGIPLERKTDYYYPEERKTTSYFLGRYRGPGPLYSSYSYMVLRLEASKTIYLDWIKISDLHEKPRLDEFDKTHKKIAEDLMSRIGVAVVFNHIQEEDSP